MLKNSSSKKIQKLKVLEEKVDKITDGLGKKLDDGIKETVMALWTHDIPTLASCEGHLDWGVPAPWVDIGEEQPEEVSKRRQENPGVRGIKKFFEMYPELVPLRKKNLKIQKKFLEILTIYYENHQVAEDCRLTFTPIDIYGLVRLSNQGFEIQEINTKTEQKEKLKQYQQEMNNFAKFLKDSFLNKV